MNPPRRLRLLPPCLVVILVLVGADIGSWAAETPPAVGPPPANDTPKRLNNSGCTCDQLDVTITKEPPSPPGVASPPAGSAGATTPGTPVGAHNGSGGPLLWEVTVKGPSDVCCQKVKTGIIQNVNSYVHTATYSGGGKIDTEAVDSASNPVHGSMVDSDPQGGAGSAYPYYSPASVGSPKKCGDAVPLSFNDFPAIGTTDYPPTANGQTLTSSIKTEKFSIFVVWECPVGTPITLKRYDWTFQVDLVYGMVNGRLSVTSYSASATPNGSGATGTAASTGDTVGQDTTRPDSTNLIGF